MPSLLSETFGSGTSVSVGMGCGAVGVAKGDDGCGVLVAGAGVACDVADGCAVVVLVATIVTGTVAGVVCGVGVAVGVLPAHAESAMAAMKINRVSLRIVQAYHARVAFLLRIQTTLMSNVRPSDRMVRMVAPGGMMCNGAGPSDSICCQPGCTNAIASSGMPNTQQSGNARRHSSMS